MLNIINFKKYYLSHFVHKTEFMRSGKHLGIGVIALVFILSGISSMSLKTAKPNDIEGVWLAQSKESMLHITRSGQNYIGEIVWLKIPISPVTGKPKVDFRNPDPKLRDRPIIGLNIFSNFKYSTETKIGEGDIYDPKSGNTYSCRATLTDPNTLTIRGYIGAYWMGLGRTEILKRIK